MTVADMIKEWRGKSICLPVVGSGHILKSNPLLAVLLMIERQFKADLGAIAHRIAVCHPGNLEAAARMMDPDWYAVEVIKVARYQVGLKRDVQESVEQLVHDKNVSILLPLLDYDLWFVDYNAALKELKSFALPRVHYLAVSDYKPPIGNPWSYNVHHLTDVEFWMLRDGLLGKIPKLEPKPPPKLDIGELLCTVCDEEWHEVSHLKSGISEENPDMGLDTSHNCWHGAYSSFNDWRRRIADAAGIPLDEMQGSGGTRTWLKEDVITELLSHSDCDGRIEARVCIPLADRLEALIPLLPGKEPWKIEGPRDKPEMEARLISAAERMFPEGYYRTKTRQFVAGLRLAASLNENVEFR